MIKVPDYNGGFLTKSIEGSFVVTRDRNGDLLNCQAVNFVKKGLECKYGTVIDYSKNIVVLQKGSKTIRINREQLNTYLQKSFDAPEPEEPQPLLVTGTFETEAGKIFVKGIDDSLRNIIADPDKIILRGKDLLFRKSIGNKTYVAEVLKEEKQFLLKSIDVEERFKTILIKGLAATLKPPTISTGDAWNKKGGTKPGHKYIERKPHPSGEGYIYLYELPNGTGEWRDDSGKAIDVDKATKEYSVEEFKAGDNIRMGDRVGRIEETSTNFLAVNFEGKKEVINKKEHIERLKEHQLYKPGMVINTKKGDAKLLQVTDNLALIKRMDDNVLSVINLEKHITKLKKEEASELSKKINKHSYVDQGYAGEDYKEQYKKEDYANTKEYLQYQEKATKAGLGDGELERKKFVKVGKDIRTVKWKYEPNSKETIVYADGVKDHPLNFAGEKYFIRDINSEGYTLDSKSETGLFLSHKDYDNYAAQENKDAVWADAYDNTGGKLITRPKKTIHISGELSPEQQARVDAEKQREPSYKVRWKKREAPAQTEEEKANIEAERQQKLVKIKEALGSDAYKQFENTATERGFDIGENKFTAQKTIEIEGNKFVVQSEFDPEAGTSNRVNGKYSDLELGDNIYPITDITKDRVFYNEQGTEKSVSVEELKQINGKKVFEPTKESKGLISSNSATKFYFSPEEGDTASGFYEVIELKDLVASHGAGGEANPNYAIGDAQNRDRSLLQSKAQVAKIATNPNFDLLSDNRTAQDGAPVVNEDYNVIAGNGRGIGIGEHYKNGGDKYKNDLIKNAKRLGFNADEVSGMQQPVLVRRINVDNAEAQRLGAKSNESNMLKTEAREEAKGKATRIDDKTFNSIADIFKSAKGDYSSLSEYLDDIGGDLVKKLSEKGIISDNEKHLFYNLESGKLDASHKDKLKELLTQSVLGDSSKHFEKIPDAAREGITKGLGELFSIKGQPSDLIPHLQNAVKILAKYNTVKDKFSNPDDFIAQDANNMLDPLKGDKKDLAMFEALTSTKPNEIKNKFKEYVAKLEGDMFEQPLSPDEAFKVVFKPKYEKGINVKADDSKLTSSQRITKIEDLREQRNKLLDKQDRANSDKSKAKIEAQIVDLEKQMDELKNTRKSLWTRVKVFGTNLFKGIDRSKNILVPSKTNPGVRRWQRVNANEEYKGIEDSIDILDIVQNNVSNIGEPTEKEIKNINTWLRQNKEKYVILFHGTTSKHPISDQGLLPTSGKRRHSYQSESGYVYLSMYPSSAEMFGKMAYPGDEINIYAVKVKIGELKPDKDQLRNKRYYSDQNIGDTLAESLIYGSGARVKRNIWAYELTSVNISEKRETEDVRDEKEEAEDFNTLDEANDWMDKKEKEYGNKNKFLASDEYKKVYPKIQELHKKAKGDYVKKGQEALGLADQKEGDEVEYSAADPFGNVTVYEGKIVMKDNIPYVKLNQKTVDGKSSVKWHKGFRKIQQLEKDENPEISKGLKVFGKSLIEGIKIEGEHNNLYNELTKRLNDEGSKMPMSKKDFFKWIAKQHIGENPDYYSLLKQYVE